MCRLSLLSVALIIGGIGPESLVAQNWSRFRGENGSGISDLPGIPSTWKDDEYAWKIELPQIGHSSPIVWEKTLFITSATEGGGERFVHCLDADSGRERWQRSIQLNRSEKHQKNSWASSTPTTDGNHVYVLFADDTRQLVIAWDFDGKEVWRRDAGAYESEHGLGASPIVHDGLLLIPNDQVGPSSMIALSTMTGDVVWQSERLPGTTSYSTPMIVSNGQAEDQIIYLSQSNGITSLDPSTGKLNWKTAPLPSRTVASPIESDGLIFATSGGGGTGKYLVALQSDPAVSDESRIVYERKTTLPYVPGMIAYNGMLFLWGDKGILVCLELLTGKEIWSHRIEGGFSGSPICIENRIYCVTESGEVVVIRAGNQLVELGRTPLHDDCHATPAVANGHLYLRTFRSLVAIKARDVSP